MQPSLNLEKDHIILKDHQNALHVWIKKFLLLSPFLQSIAEFSPELYTACGPSPPPPNPCRSRTLFFFLFNLYRIDKGCSFLPACSNSHSCLYSTQGRKQSPPLQLPWKEDVLLLPSIRGLPGYKSQTFTVFTLTAKLNITFKNTQLCWDKIKINVLHCSPTCRHTCLQNVFLFTISKHFLLAKEGKCG